MAESMSFPNTFDEFAERYKIVDKEKVYTNGTELIPIFRVKQWLEHQADVAEVKHGKWVEIVKDIGKGRTLAHYKCNLCGVYISDKPNYCYNCGAKMDAKRKKVRSDG